MKHNDAQETCRENEIILEELRSLSSPRWKQQSKAGERRKLWKWLQQRIKPFSIRFPLLIEHLKSRYWCQTNIMRLPTSMTPREFFLKHFENVAVVILKADAWGRAYFLLSSFTRTSVFSVVYSQHDGSRRARQTTSSENISEHINECRFK